MKKLNKILPVNYPYEVFGDNSVAVNGLSLDSRKISKGFLFAALPGTHANGNVFIEAAIKAGARSIICNDLPEQRNDSVTYIVTAYPANLLGLAASAFYGNPSQKLELVGVTGTNGKTTVATLLYQLFRILGYKCGLISTPGIWIEDRKIESTHTTPDAISLHKLICEMAEADCDFVFMEVSSHAVIQNRIAGLHFRGGIFTNLTHDHLDYHKTFENYRDAKKAFFDGLDTESFALTNIDDKNGKFMLQNTSAMRVSYGLQNPADFKAKVLESDLHGMQMLLDDEEIYTQLTGLFNGYNLLAVYAAARLMDVDKSKLIPAVSALKPVEGRFSQVHINEITGIVDYAHTPDALKNILESIHEINHGGNRIITVVGCGGNRDQGKRPIMAKIASELSDELILTSDNPRDEDAEKILFDMEQGIPINRRKKALIISDRKEAIEAACSMARKGDIILVAGKGHEKYQEIRGVRHEFDDRKVLEELLKETRS